MPNCTTSHNIWQKVPPLTCLMALHNSSIVHHFNTCMFSETCQVPAIALARIQRSSLTLSAYNYSFP